MAGRKTKRGTSGNAVKYVTRNQALKKLQLHLGEFRRLCILKGIHPREPNKKTQGQNKTYYHVKDLSFLAHEPLVAKLREQHAYEKKVRKARAKRNAELAAALVSRRPTYTLDRLVKERYPSFMDALRDLDDPLTLCHLFSVLPAEGAHGIPAAQVAMSRRVALEWQAYVVRSHSLRRIFISVKGFFFQAEVMGQSLTWLVPHQLPQVLPNDVDYRVMLTFLEFYHTLLRFVHFRLYRDLGASYPPRVDEKLEAAAAGITALITDLAASGASATTAAAAAAVPGRMMQGGGEGHPPVVQPPADQAAAAAGSDGDGGNDEDALSIDSGASDDDGEEAGNSASGSDEDGDEGEGQEGAAHHQQEGGNQRPAAQPGSGDVESVTDAAAVSQEMSVAGGALSASPDDDAAICASLFRGLVFFLGREVPREVLLLVIRSFGGVAAWAGEGSPHAEADECITHQVVDRPTQGHKFLSRAYVQPQWLVDAANFRVLPDVGRYAPGRAPPPHLSPFAAAAADGEEDHLPDYQLELRHLQEAAKAARMRAESGPNATFLLEQEAEADAAEGAVSSETVAAPAAAAASAEAAYQAELRAEMQEAGEVGEEVAAAAPHRVDAPTEEDALVADMLLPRKKRKLYASAVKAQAEKRSKTATLRARAAQAAAAATSAK